MKKLFLIIAVSFATVATGLAALDAAKIDNLTGLKGKMNEKEGVYKVTFPRDDVKIAVGGWTMPPFMGLGTWAAFTKGAHTEAMVMGDTVLFEDEANPAMSTALENGLSVTALHNHFFFDHPKVYFMHIEGEGTVEQLAGAVREGLAILLSAGVGQRAEVAEDHRAHGPHTDAPETPVVRGPPARRFRAVDQDPRRTRLPLSAAPLCEPLISLARLRRCIPRGFIRLAFRSNPNHAGCYRGSRLRAARSRNSSGPAKSWKMRGISSLESPTRFSQNVGYGFQGPFHSESSHS